MADVIGIGSPALDLFFKTDGKFLKKLNLKPEDDYLFEDKNISPDLILKNLTQISQSPGGIAINTLATLGKLGVHASFVGVIGTDKNAEFWMKSIKGIDMSFVKKLGKMSRCFCLLTNKGKNRTFLSDVNKHENDFLSSIDQKNLNSAKIVHIGPLIKNDKEGLKATIDIVKKINGPKISFSPSIFYTKNGYKPLIPILNKTHILFINKKELKYLAGVDQKMASKKLLEFGPKIVVCTMADEGSLVTTKEKQFEVPRINAKNIIDTTGAGDAYAAGFLYGLLNNKTLEWSAKLASLTAAKSLTDYGLNWLKKYDFRDTIKI